MQSMYSNPNQMAVAAAAAAAASAAAANGSGPQRLQYPGLPHQQPPQQQHGTGNIISASRMHGAGQNGKILQSITGCEPDDAMGQSTPAANGSRGVDPNESEMGSDVESENDDDDDDINNIDLEKLDTSHREMLEKLKRQQREERDEIERELNDAIAMTSSKLHNGKDMDFEKRSTGSLRSESESELPTQTEIKYQRPLGLLAQHGLSVKSGAAAKSIAGNSSGSHLMQLQMQQQQQQEERQMLDQEDEKEYEMQDDESELIDKDKQLDRDIFREQDREKERLTDLDFSNHLSLMDRRFMPSPPPGTPPNHDPNKSSPPSGHHWTFEEQFKQLYEMSLEPKRKEFLDELFSFMQKRGTPVNRIPIMAKQTLDLYELFRLVVSKGGLVEVINKKLWREITKGLNLPSSITSAAFTLRTQYMKYLYPYECEKLKLSTLAELQSAIDGNRREGRRPGYGYDFSPIPTMLSTPPNPHMNGPLRPMLTGRPPTGLSPKDDEHPLLASTHNHLRSLAEHDARAMEAATRAMEEVTKRMEEASRAAIPMSKTMTSSSLGNTINTSTKYETPPCKRPAMFDEDRFMTHVGMHSTHIKMTSQSNGRLEYDNSMIVSMEINGMMYQGVLFAQHPRRI